MSVTNPFDPAFGADVAMRDHRKLAFRDVFEDDPASGEAVFTGEGVGEHYNGPSWEDRSILVQGTALEGLKTSTRELLRSQGYRDEEIPGYLRARPRSESHDRQCQEMIDAGWNTPVLLARNETGYGDKQSSVLKALTYNLTPVGGFLISFDSLWISEYWAGMFLAAALRGAHVYVVAPTSRNAPSSALPTMVLLRENLNRMRKASDRLQVEIERAGGSFHVGLYAQTVSVDDLQGNVRSFLEGYRRYPFLQRELGLHPSVLEVLDELVAAGADPTDRADPGDSRIEIERKHDPFLHLKTQFLASDEAFEAVQLPEWASVTRAYLRTRDRQLHGSGRERVTPDLLGVSPGSGGNGPSLSEALDGRLAIRGAAAPDRRVSSWLVGSQNQDRRGMLSDGEIMVAVSGPAALTAMVDLILLLGSATWPTAEPEFDAVFPPFEGPPFLERAFRVIKDAI